MVIIFNHKVQVIGVVGAGTMGAGIAQVALQAGYLVKLCDVQAAMREKAQQDIEARLLRLAEKGNINGGQVREMLDSLVTCADLSELNDADVVIEAVPERIELKTGIFQRLDDICADTTIFATNTSSLSITVIAAQTRHPQRVVGMHYFNPAPVMRLVEVIVGEDTSSAIVDVTVQLARQMGKEPIVCKDTPGFIVNRVARNFYGESLRIVGEGTATMAQVDDLLEHGAGFRMGPFALMDLIGIDVNYDVTRAVYTAYHGEPRYRPHMLQEKMVASLRFGRKSGRGFYTYDASGNMLSDGRAQVSSAETEQASVELSGLVAIGNTPLAEALQMRISEVSTRPLADCGLIFSESPEWAKAEWLERLDAIAVWLKHQNIKAIILSFAGSTEHHRRLVQHIERFVANDVWIFTSVATVSATQQAQWLIQRDRLRGVDIALPLSDLGATPQAVAYARPMQVATVVTDEALVWLSALHLRAVPVRDGAGGVMTRVLAMVFNEAAEVMREGVAKATDVDLAMRLGTNYPQGPLEWMDLIGLPTVWFALRAMWDEYGDDRYRPSPLLKQMVLAGYHGQTSGNGWYKEAEEQA